MQENEKLEKYGKECCPGCMERSADQLDFIGDSKLFILSEIYTQSSGWCSSKLVFKNRRYV